VPQGALIKFISAIVRDLINQQALGLTALVRNKFPLARAMRDLIARYRKEAQVKGYQQVLFSSGARPDLSAEFTYKYSPDHYPAKAPFYSGSFKFEKHYYGANKIEDLKATGEEFECARAIDTLPSIKYWIRNLVRREHGSFWLPRAHGKFHPDFVAELKDGCILVVEYKGAHLADSAESAESAEKETVGKEWARCSDGQCIFLMAVDQKTNPKGRDTSTQVLDSIGS